MHTASVQSTANEPEPRCGRCGYIVIGLPGHRCPECGSDLRLVGLRRAGDGDVKWIIVVVAAALAVPTLVWMVTPRRTLDGAGFIAFAGAVSLLVALASVRLLHVRWWAWPILLIGAMLTFPISVIGKAYALLIRAGMDGAGLTPGLTNAWIAVAPLLCFAWVPALLLVRSRSGARFRSPRAREFVLPAALCLWTILAVCECGVSTLGLLVARDRYVTESVSPDGRWKALVYGSGFMDWTYTVYVKRNGPFTVTCRRLGRVDGDAVAGEVGLDWSGDSRSVAFTASGRTNGRWNVKQ